MGQVVSFNATPSAYPPPTASLDSAESAVLITIRWLAAAFRGGEAPMPHLFQRVETTGTHGAAFSVNVLIGVIARTARHLLEIHCTRCPHLSDDEKHTLHAERLAQAGKNAMAACALRTALLTAQGAEFALGPLKGLGELFTEAKLFFHRQRSVAEDLPPVNMVGLGHPLLSPGRFAG